MVLPDMNQGPETPAQCQDSQEPDDDSGPHDADADTHGCIGIDLDPFVSPGKESKICIYSEILIQK